MGLDITHYRATLENPQKLDPFHTCFCLEEDFARFDTHFQYFEKYIQDVDKPLILTKLIFVRKKEDLEKIKEYFKNDDYEVQFANDENSILEATYKTVKAHQQFDTFLHGSGGDSWGSVDVYRLVKEKGFYYETLGYQRGNMNDKFFNRFYSETICCFTAKEDFDYAYDCTDYFNDRDTEKSVELRRNYFKENFVDKYLPNASWISLSY